MYGCEYAFNKVGNDLETEENWIHISDLEPYSKYSFRIQSINDHGISDSTKKFSFNTKAAKPSPPRDILIEFLPTSDEFGPISAILRWKIPCKLNGHPSHVMYMISIKGRNPGFENVSITEASSLTNFTLTNVKRGYEYEVIIKAQFQEHNGEPASFKFEAPSGSEFD